MAKSGQVDKDGWKRVKAEPIILKANQVAEGKLVSWGEIVDDKGKSRPVPNITTADGFTVPVFCGANAIQALQALPLGVHVRIRRTGEKLDLEGGRTMVVYEVDYRPDSESGS